MHKSFIWINYVILIRLFIFLRLHQNIEFYSLVDAIIRIKPINTTEPIMAIKKLPRLKPVIPSHPKSSVINPPNNAPTMPMIVFAIAH